MLTSTSDPNERAWFWLPKETDSEKAQWEDLLDSPLVERQYLFQSDVVRVRVTTEKFYDVEPGPPKANAAAPGADERRSPYVVTVRSLSSMQLALDVLTLCSAPLPSRDWGCENGGPVALKKRELQRTPTEMLS